MQIEWTIIISRSDAKYARQRASSIGARALGLDVTTRVVRSLSLPLFMVIRYDVARGKVIALVRSTGTLRARGTDGALSYAPDID